MRLVTLVAAVVLIAAAPAAAQDAVDVAAEALRGDPVYVDPDAERALTESEANALRDQIEGGLYVAVLPASAGDAESIAAALQSRLGGSVGRGGRRRLPRRRDRSCRGRRRRGVRRRRRGRAGAARLRRAHDTARSLPRTTEAAGPAASSSSASRARAARPCSCAAGSRRQAEAVEFAEVKTNARDDLVALGDDIRALDLDVEMPGVSPDVRADYEQQAVNSYDKADSKWKVARRPRDLEPVGWRRSARRVAGR